MFVVGLVIGTSVGTIATSILMYYVQPQVKMAMAQLLNREKQLVVTYDQLAAEARELVADRHKYGA